ncbi:MAG: hypothetical protein R6U32_01220 [Candidatus Woesearchaeota archaeon]
MEAGKHGYKQNILESPIYFRLFCLIVSGYNTPTKLKRFRRLVDKLKPNDTKLSNKLSPLKGAADRRPHSVLLKRYTLNKPLIEVKRRGRNPSYYEIRWDTFQNIFFQYLTEALSSLYNKLLVDEKKYEKQRKDLEKAEETSQEDKDLKDNIKSIIDLNLKDIKAEQQLVKEVKKLSDKDSKYFKDASESFKELIRGSFIDYAHDCLINLNLSDKGFSWHFNSFLKAFKEAYHHTVNEKAYGRDPSFMWPAELKTELYLFYEVCGLLNRENKFIYNHIFQRLNGVVDGAGAISSEYVSKEAGAFVIPGVHKDYIDESGEYPKIFARKEDMESEGENK